MGCVKFCFRQMNGIMMKYDFAYVCYMETCKYCNIYMLIYLKHINHTYILLWRGYISLISQHKLNLKKYTTRYPVVDTLEHLAAFSGKNIVPADISLLKSPWRLHFGLTASAEAKARGGGQRCFNTNSTGRQRILQLGLKYSLSTIVNRQ